MTRPTTSAASEYRSASVPFTQTPPTAIYEMRMLRTAAEREEAAALVQDRQRWLTMHGLPVPARADIPALFREAQTMSAGLYEDGKLLACMIPERDPDLGWGQGPCLFLQSVHTLPGQSDDITRLITLWASDFAARLDLQVVRAETLARHTLEADPSLPSCVGSPTTAGTCADPAPDATAIESPASNSPPSTAPGSAR